MTIANSKTTRKGARPSHLRLVTGTEQDLPPVGTQINIREWRGKLPSAPRVQFSTLNPRAPKSALQKALATPHGRAELVARRLEAWSDAVLKCDRAAGELSEAALIAAGHGDRKADALWRMLYEARQLIEQASGMVREERRTQGAA